MTYTGEILATMDQDGLHISSRRMAEKLEKKSLSPSLVNSFVSKESCLARWAGEQFVTREIIDQELDTPGARGSLFHNVMEGFFAHAPEERTPTLMKRIVKEVLQKEEFNHFIKNKEAIAWLRGAINGYYTMGGEPEKVQIATLVNKDGREKSGIEYFIKGRIGNTKREILGFIDVIVLDPTKTFQSLVVQDWKTGKVKRWNPKTKGEEGLNEQRQQSIYAALLKAEGHEVSGARLVYPVSGDVVEVQLGNEELQSRIVEDIEEADATMDTLIETNTFEYSPSFLCAWCPLAKVCPQAMIKPFQKAQDAFASQPDIEVLAQGIELL